MSAARPRRRFAVALIAALLALTTAGASPARAVPSSFDALGDSITRAFNTACPFYWTDCALTNSWATGSNSKVNSVYTRLTAFGPVTRYNDAVSGAKMANLPSQATTAVGRNVEAVTILMGANDACGGSSGVMTEVSSYQANFEKAMETLSAGLPSADIKVGSVPDIYQLWELFYKNKSAVSAWQSFKMCESMLANPPPPPRRTWNGGQTCVTASRHTTPPCRPCAPNTRAANTTVVPASTRNSKPNTCRRPTTSIPASPARR